MKNQNIQHSAKTNTGIFNFAHIILASISVCALVVTFLTASSALDFQNKIIVFLAIVFVYLLACAAFFALQKQPLNFPFGETEDLSGVFSWEIENKLTALEEANEFFGASLKPADMFRLVSSRIKEIIPFASSALFLVEDDKTMLRAAFADGENAESMLKLESDLENGLIGKTFSRRRVQHEENLLPEKKTHSAAAALKNLNSAVSVPLLRETEVFGVLTLYANDAGDFDADSLRLLDAIGTRVAPLFLSSFAFERNLANALTDALTNLPNERAFYLVVENQIAESQRFREARPLTILTADLKNFNELNQKFGHATGDRVLEFAAGIIRKQLRQMDFLARSRSDEFLAVLPTADEQITKEVVERIEKAFDSNPFAVSRMEKIHLAINFGAATFWKDGETVNQLLQNAHLRKQQSKSPEKSKVLWFPKEIVN